MGPPLQVGLEDASMGPNRSTRGGVNRVASRLVAARIDRRTLVKGALLGGASALLGGLVARPARAERIAAAVSLSPRDVPTVTGGVASGDVTSGSAIVWSRADRPSRLRV